jgi:hypothetical protein
MSTILLDDIRKNAKLEAHYLKHDYIGVEHLTIALLNMKGSMTTHLLDEAGILPSYVVEHIRKKVGKGNSGQFFSEYQQTPRLLNLVKAATEHAVRDSRPLPEERDVLYALLSDPDSLPMRVLQALKIDVDELKASAATLKHDSGVLHFPLNIEFAPNSDVSNITLVGPVRHLLQRMFHGYEKIRIERQLSGGYTRAQLFVVTPIQLDDIEYAPVVVKIARTHDIADEARRYDSYIKSTLPPLTARLEEHPIFLENSDFGGLKYTLIPGPKQRSISLTEIALEWSPEEIGTWLRQQLYPTFGRLWWMQARPNLTEVWKEYDWLLPPLMILDYVPTSRAPDDSVRIRPTVKKSQLIMIRHGDLVTVEGFNVQKIDTQKRELTLAINGGSGVEKAYRIRIRNVDFEHTSFFRGEVIEHLTGTFWESRQDQLLMAVRDLAPDFNPEDDMISPFPDLKRMIPNPLKRYELVLDWQFRILLSKIHGDMHTGNIMIGPENVPFLIDFALARDGHTLFDWACLEISLLNAVVMPHAGIEWKEIRELTEVLSRLNVGIPLSHTDPLSKALIPIADVRRVVEAIMTHTNRGIVDWPQYHLALAMCALRAVTWETPTPNRRLMFFVAALAFQEMTRKESPAISRIRDTLQPDDS